MPRETRSSLQIKIDAARRLVMWHCLSESTPYYLITEFPKSGGSWVGQMMAAYFDVPFPRNKNVSLLRRYPCVLHGHHKFSPHFKNVIYLVRDGRDTMVSSYFHELFDNERNPAWAVARFRAEHRFEDYNDVKGNLPAFIEYKFTKYASVMFTNSWSEFVVYVTDKNANVIKYEDLLLDAPATFGKAIGKIIGEEPDMDRIREICDRFSFAKQSNRKPGEEDRGSFLRKGIAGDWKNNFTRAACEMFDKYGGDALIAAGYEKDHSWVKLVD